MYDYDNRDLFYVDGTDKQYLIICAQEDEEEEPITLTNADIKDDEFEIFDAIMNTDSLTFANCLSCYVRFITYYTESLMGSVIAVYEVIDGDTSNPIPIGFFTVQSDNISTDGKTREIIAYDQMYDVINTDITEWYNAIEFPITIKDLRDSICEEFGIEQEDVELICDDISVPKQLSENELSAGARVIKAIAEINGVFPHIGKDGLLHWISLDTGDIHAQPLYPSTDTYPSMNTYPGFTAYSGNLFNIYKGYYKENDVVWANYDSLEPDGVQIRNEENEIAYQTNEVAENPYTIISNFLCYNLEEGQYETIATRLFNKIKSLTYVPFQMNKMGDPCLEVGDRVVIFVKDQEEVVSYIFSKHSTGILVPFEATSASGTQYLNQYEVGRQSTNTMRSQLKNLDNRVGNIERSGSGPLQIVSVANEPENPQLNVLYLIQGTVEVS